MAGGRGILDASGRLLIRSDGTVDVCEDCCNVYSRWRKCGSLTGEIYTRDSDAAPNPFKRISDGLCWSRVSTGQALPGGATLLDPADWTTDAGCCVCGGCDAPLSGSTISITFAGIDITACLENSSPFWGKFVDWDGPDPNTTVNKALSGCLAGNAIGTTPSPGTAKIQRYTDGASCGTPSGPSDSYSGASLRWDFRANGFEIGMQANRDIDVDIFRASLPGAEWCSGFVVSNTLASGGTATVTFA